MFRYLQLILTLALLSVIALPSVAHAGGTPSYRVFVSGNASNEAVELYYYLLPFVIIDDQKRFMRDPECGFNITIEASGVDELSSLATTEFVALAAGAFQIVQFEFSEFTTNGPGAIVLTFSEPMTFGPCTVLFDSRTFDISSGDTRSSLPLDFGICQTNPATGL